MFENTVPVHKNDAGEEGRHSYGEKVCQRHVVGQVLGHTVRHGPIGQRDIVHPPIIPAALTQGVVTVVAIVHHSI